MYSYETEPAEVRRWLAIAAPGRLVLVDAQGDEAAAAAFASSLPEDAALAGVLDRLAAGGLSSTPAFAAAAWSADGLTVIVRGLAVAVIDTAAGSTTVDASRATTWVEEHTTDAVAITLRSDQSNPGGVRLPLRDGAVWTTSVSATIDDVEVAGVLGSRSAAQTPSAEPSSAGHAPSAAEQLAAPPVPTPAEPAAVEPPRVASVSDTQFFHDEDETEPVAPVAEPADEGYDFLFGQTVLRPVGAAAVDDTVEGGPDSDVAQPTVSEPLRSEAVDLETPAQVETAADALGDHDGHTIFAEDLAALRARRASESAPAAASQPKAAPLTFLELPGGTRQSLASPVVLGRAPTVSQVPASVVPTLVTLVGDDISRSHVRVAVEGGTVVVTDLHSRNGTQVVLPGKAPQTLRPGEPTPVIVGTVIDLGGDVTLRVREG